MGFSSSDQNLDSFIMAASGVGGGGFSMAGGSGTGEPPKAPKDTAVAFDWLERYASLKLEMVALKSKLEKEMIFMKKNVACLQGVVGLMSIATLVVTATTILEDSVMWQAFTRWLLTMQGLGNGPKEVTFAKRR